MTADASQASQAEQDGQGPAPEPAVTGAERVMGLLAVAAAVALLAMGLDMITGGAVFRALGLGDGDDSGG